MALAPDGTCSGRQQRHRAQGEGVAAAEKWVGIFWRGGQMVSFETRLGKPAGGRAGAAGAEFGSAAWRRGVQACTETGASAGCEARGFVSAAGPSPPHAPTECSELPLAG